MLLLYVVYSKLPEKAQHPLLIPVLQSTRSAVRNVYSLITGRPTV